MMVKAISRAALVTALFFLGCGSVAAERLVDRLLRGEPVPAPARGGSAQDVPLDPEQPVVSRTFAGGAGPDGGQEADYQGGLVAFYFKDYEKAEALWRTPAQQGHAKAQANLAWLYQHGAGVERDLDEAYRWYRRAAQQGHAVAQNNVGVFLHKGWAGGKAGEAEVWYRRAAEQGYGYAQFNLAEWLLERGRGGEARQWLERAAAQSVEAAKERLATLPAD